MDYVKTIPAELREGSDVVQAEFDHAKLLESQLRLLEGDYTEDRSLSVTCAAFNVNQKRPPDPLELRKWLQLDAPDPPRILAVGLQEVDMSAQAMVIEHSDAARPWNDALGRATHGQWDLVGAKQLVGLWLAVYVHRDWQPYAQGGEIAVVRCGAMGNQMANKGGVGLRLRIHRTTFAFVTVHLAAHMNEVQKRNRDFERIVETMNFAPPSALPVLLRDHDRVFVFGDLNYRIELGYDECLRLIERAEWAQLRQRDQLCQQFAQRGSPYCRMAFRDAPPDFAPTYKYDSGSRRYDSSEKKRVPAWTDRALWWARGYSDPGSLEDPIRLRRFWRHEVLTSDHRPVAATFDTTVKVERPEAKERIRQDIVRTMQQVGTDKFALTHVVLDRQEIDFGDVPYGAGPAVELLVKNEGHAVTLVRLNLCTPSSGDPSRPGARVPGNQWLSASPPELCLGPGKSEALIVRCCADREAVAPLQARGPFSATAEHPDPPALCTFLVVSAGQQRFWVECSARIRPSCFGARLEHVAALGLVPAAQGYALSADWRPPPPPRPTVPKELWFMVDYVARCGARTPELFEDDLSPEAFEAIRSHLDERCEPFAEGSVCVRAVSDAIIKFLCDLQSPVIPEALHESCMRRQTHQSLQQLLQQGLPAVNFNIFHYLVAFLRFLLVAPNQLQNCLTPDFLAGTFGTALLQRPARGAPPAQQERERVAARDLLAGFLRVFPVEGGSL
eukprot:TRINITY_DN39443_c0_g1_i1.p1 TRINITY_DN39443_c0_g1~~TRINITY_DN39443_c0_g1_i1.p1  ORF type:complete len:750 (+),score=279.09 TRINITY_DN39443_c0_g1_i1:66-2252(+)